jgi:glycosyltransferase involved in cell wall biosynthesis
MSPLRVLLTIHHHLDPDSGAPGTAISLATELRRLGHEVTFYSWEDLPARLPPVLKEVVFPEFVARRLHAEARRGSVDVVEALTGDLWLWAAARRRKSPMGPALVTRSPGLEHGYYAASETEARAKGRRLPLRTRLYHGRMRLREVDQSLRRSDLVLVLNDDDRDFAIHSIGVEVDRIRVVRNGISDELLGLPMPELNDHEPVRIAQIGSYEERKGIRYGAHALRSVLRRHGEVCVKFVGTGCPRGAVLDDFPSGLHSRIEVVSSFRRSELPKMLVGFSVQLFPTLAEGFGKALVEGMALGLAPVATATPGPRTILDDEINGLLVPPRDGNAAEQALERLIQDAALRGRLRRQTHATAQDYRWAALARRQVELYAEAIERSSRRLKSR